MAYYATIVTTLGIMALVARRKGPSPARPREVRFRQTVLGLIGVAAVGLLVNISSEGMQMITREELGLNQVLELAVELPESMEDNETLDLDAEIVWTRPNDHLGVIDNGLRLRYVSSEAAEKLKSLIRYYTS